MKKILSLIFFLLFTIFFTGNVMAQSAVIINQVRGPEQCCQPGSMDLINAVYDNKQISDLPIGWAVRYDVLSDKQIINSLKGEVGGLIEVTPQFASESGVVYNGKEDGSDWHLAKNVFLIGYTQDERKKLIDTYFKKFESVFGYYPSFTVSWMIDSWSLNYLSGKYSVKLHEITKEQYHTDTYTLYGGIFNSPYYPSKNNPIIPSKTNNSIIIIRQTISDPIYNYGFPKAFYTSQPNDYLSKDIGKKDFSYFKSLVDNLANQKSGFPLAVVGLENSFHLNKYKDEYINQIKHLKSTSLQIYSPSEMVNKFKSQFDVNKPYTIEAIDEVADVGVTWYFSPFYRARVLSKDGTAIITDLRNYAQVEDPYFNDQAVMDHSYYIALYLIDGSQVPGDVEPDIERDSFGLVVDKKENIEFKENEIIVSDFNSYFRFPKKYYLKDIINLRDEKVITSDYQFDFVFRPNKDVIQMGYINEDKYIFLFSLSKLNDNYILRPLNSVDISSFEAMFQPDKSDLAVDTEKSIFSWHNISATANRNPLRFFIRPLNRVSKPARVQKVQLVFADDKGISVDYPADFETLSSPWFVDITSSRPLSTEVTVLIDDMEVYKQKIFFLPNCKSKPSSCLTSLQVVIQYVSYKLSQIPAKLFPAPQSYEKDN